MARSFICTDADDVLAARDADRVAIFVAVDVDNHRWSASCVEPLHKGVGNDDPGVVAGRSDRGIELETDGISRTHRCLSPVACIMTIRRNGGLPSPRYVSVNLYRFAYVPVRPCVCELYGWTHPLLEMVDSAVAVDLVPIQLVPVEAATSNQ